MGYVKCGSSEMEKIQETEALLADDRLQLCLSCLLLTANHNTKEAAVNAVATGGPNPWILDTLLGLHPASAQSYL